MKEEEIERSVEIKRIELEMIVLSVNDESVNILIWIFVLKMKMSILNESKEKRCYFSGIEVRK